MMSVDCKNVRDTRDRFGGAATNRRPAA